jgi:hypothetical protein
MDGPGEARAVRAVTDAGLHVTGRLRVLPRPGRPATYAVVTAATGAAPAADAREPDTLAMREASGESWSGPFQRLRARLDLPGS